MTQPITAKTQPNSIQNTKETENANGVRTKTSATNKNFTLSYFDSQPSNGLEFAKKLPQKSESASHDSHSPDTNNTINEKTPTKVLVRKLLVKNAQTRLDRIIAKFDPTVSCLSAGTVKKQKAQSCGRNNIQRNSVPNPP